MLCILKTFVAWIVVMFVIRNLVGLTLQVIANKVDLGERELTPAIDSERRKLTAITIFLTAMSFAVIFALYYFWNWKLALAGVMIWVGCFPEQLWSAQTGRHTREAPSTVLGYVGTMLTFGSLPVIWFSICR